MNAPPKNPNKIEKAINEPNVVAQVHKIRQVKPDIME
jgi:hypothetical protein